MEVEWTKKQKQACKERVKAAVVRSKRSGEFLSWDGFEKMQDSWWNPTSVEDFENFVPEDRKSKKMSVTGNTVPTNDTPAGR